MMYLIASGSSLVGAPPEIGVIRGPSGWGILPIQEGRKFGLGAVLSNPRFQGRMGRETSYRRRPQVHLSAVPHLRAHRAGEPGETGELQVSELRARRKRGRERSTKHPGAGTALRGSTYLNGECVPREAPPFRAGVVHPRLLYEMADDGLIHRASRFTWELKENA